MNQRLKFFCGTLVLALMAVCFSLTTIVDSQSTTLTEGFEAGGKTSYTAATVQLTSGQWYLDDALTGNLDFSHPGSNPHCRLSLSTGEDCASISGASGNLFFYINGNSVRDSNNDT